MKDKEGNVIAKVATNTREAQIDKGILKAEEEVHTCKFELEINQAILAYLSKEKAKFK